MLESNQGPDSVGVKERCQPDYETMILQLKNRLKRSVDFRDATLRYFNGHLARGNMAELIGELVTKCSRMEKELASLVTQQEKSQESTNN